MHPVIQWLAVSVRAVHASPSMRAYTGRGRFTEIERHLRSSGFPQSVVSRRVSDLSPGRYFGIWHREAMRSAAWPQVCQNCALRFP
jgi:hypothetical protein